MKPFISFFALILMSGFGMTMTTKSSKLDLLDLDCVPYNLPTIDLPDSFAECAKEVSDAEGKTHPDQGKKTVFNYYLQDFGNFKDQIISYYGYSVKMYNVTSADGYIVLVHHITGGEISPPASGKPSVYLHHGMLGSSDNWLFQYGDRNFAFKLADAGYNVFLMNARGTTYSQGHTTLNSNTDLKYWDFCWHEMGFYDIPAVLDKIKDVTGNNQVYYVGHSMGTTAFFVALSEIPALNSRFIAAFLFSPVAYIGHSNSPVRYVAPALGIGGQYLLDPVLRGRIDQSCQLETLLGVSLAEICTPTATRCGICANAVFGVFNYDAPQMNYTNLPNILSKIPNTISVKTLIHYAQTMQSCRFQKFDYGIDENVKRYGSSTPPLYDLTKITAPTYFFYGDYDNLAVPEDVAYTQSQMLDSTVVQNIRVDWDLFNHVDFVIAKDADKLLYNQVLSLMQDNSRTSS